TAAESKAPSWMTDPAAPDLAGRVVVPAGGGAVSTPPGSAISAVALRPARGSGAVFAAAAGVGATAASGTASRSIAPLGAAPALVANAASPLPCTVMPPGSSG